MANASSTVTRQPRVAQVEATSAPMKPAPMTITCAPSVAVTAARKASASSSVRNVKRPSAVARDPSVPERAPQAGWPRWPGRARHRRCSSLPVVELDLARRRRRSRTAPVAEHLVHEQLARAPPVGQHRLLGRPRPGEDLLGEGRPVVGQMALPAHQGDGPLVALGAQRLDGARHPARDATDDDHRALTEMSARHGLLRSPQNPNIAIHSSAERGRKTYSPFGSAVSPMEVGTDRSRVEVTPGMHGVKVRARGPDGC